MSEPLSRRVTGPTVALLRKELASYFQTPIAYVVGVFFLAVSAVLFFSVFFLFDRTELRLFFGNLPLLLAFLVPLLSMRLVAEERRSGTYELLATLPIRSIEVVAAKFLGVWITTLFFLVPTLVFAFSVSLLGRLDVGPVVGGYFGAAMLAALYAAIGVFASTAARSSTIALLVGWAICLLFALLESFLVLVPSRATSIVQFLSVGFHFTGFTRGLVDTRSVTYFLSAAAVFITLAHRTLVTRR